LEHERTAASIRTWGDSGSSSIARLPSAIASSNRPLEGQRHAELIVRERVIRVERESPPEFALAPRPGHIRKTA
jgi:hypothetical protein